MELLDVIKDITYQPFGPDDYAFASFLLNKEILCSNEKQSLGSYAILKAIEQSPYGPYAVEHSWNPGKIVHCKWVVMDHRI